MPLDTTMRDDSWTAELGVRVTMMQIGHVRMIVGDGPMSVLVCMRAFNERLVMIVVRVGVARQMVMLGFSMRMEMDVPRSLQEQNPHAHQQRHQDFA